MTHESIEFSLQAQYCRFSSAMTRKNESLRTAGWTRSIDHISGDILKTYVDTQRHSELLALRPEAVVVGSVRQTRFASRENRSTELCVSLVTNDVEKGHCANSNSLPAKKIKLNESYFSVNTNCLALLQIKAASRTEVSRSSSFPPTAVESESFWKCFLRHK